MGKLFFVLFIICLCCLIQESSTVITYNKIEAEDYVGLVRGGICSIPTFGAALDSVFIFIFNRFYPKQEAYLTVKQFNERMDFIMKDMKEYTHAAIEDSIKTTCEYQFYALRKSSYNYAAIVQVWKDQMKANGTTSLSLKTNLPCLFYDFKTKLEDAIIQFSIPSRIKYLLKLYMDTSILYQALLRDAHFYGISMGLEPNLINGTHEETTFIL
ncbi:hypothetical protein ACTA71_005429 [Dictyostelium dimigraforme]